MSKDEVADRLRSQIAIVQKVLRALDGVRQGNYLAAPTAQLQWMRSIACDLIVEHPDPLTQSGFAPANIRPTSIRGGR
jgi:hypothetical protein